MNKYINEEYKEIADKLIDELSEFEEIKESDVRIVYLSSEKEKKKNHKLILGECCKVDEKYSWCCPYDFLIIIYEPNIAGFTEWQLKTLIRHELHHVGIDYTNNGETYSIIPHDVEEFWSIINECGIDWSEDNAERG